MSTQEASYPKLLMISDLEGCAEFDITGGVPQTTILCKKSTFDALHKFLEENKDNKIAFLGDYFDKGPFVVESINGIVNLHKNNPDKVHIILGNRDVNKLRFIYEFTMPKQKFDLESEGKSITPFWHTDIINGITTGTTDPFEKLQLILKNTMAAGPPAYDSTKNIALQIKDKETDERYLAKLLVSVFNEEIGNSISAKSLTNEDEDFIKNCRYLYENSKIVHYDSDFKVLLSHAGGFTQDNDFILSDTSYYQKILDEMNNTITEENYFVKLFETQNKLTKAPEKVSEEKSLEVVLNFHNDLLKESLKFNDKGMPSKEFILLQAMGLSGTPNYYSFIASCGLNGGCSLDFKINLGLISKMKIKGIKFVASGHQPHCTTVPMIYKQGDVVFIANDTSNGYRPDRPKENKNPLTLKNIPLSFIEMIDDIESNKNMNQKGILNSSLSMPNEKINTTPEGADLNLQRFECGVCSIGDNGELIKASDENEIKGLSKDGKDDNYYEELIKSYANLNDIPSVEDVKNILEKTDGKFEPLTVIKKRSNSGIIVGGKRKSKKNSKKSRRRSKSGKRTHKCLHGCKHR